MSSTNKTAKLGLSQFLGTDKPAWLGDYNSDMQKIDDGFANLEQGGQSSAADIAALQQKDVELEQNITDVNDRVDTVSADLITVGNRTTVLEGNYDTIHHELVLTKELVDNHSELIDENSDKLSHTSSTYFYINVTSGDDETADGSSAKPFKTLKGLVNKYPNISTYRIDVTGDLIVDIANLYGNVVFYGASGNVICNNKFGVYGYLHLSGCKMTINSGAEVTVFGGLDIRLKGSIEINGKIILYAYMHTTNTIQFSGTGEISAISSIISFDTENIQINVKVTLNGSVMLYPASTTFASIDDKKGTIKVY